MTDRANGFIGSLQTPCVRNCCLDENDTCLGCYRSLSEILGWNEATEKERTEVLARCRHRYKIRHGRDPDEGA